MTTDAPGPRTAAAPPAERGMARNALSRTAGTLASRLLGMARETMIAASFDEASTDAFFIAWRVPNALRSLLAEGATTFVYVPVLSDAMGKKEGAARLAALRTALARVKAISLLVLAVTSLLGMLFARPLFRLMSGGFHGDAARFELGASLLRILFPYILFMGWFALNDAALRLVNEFDPGSLAPVMLNVSFLLAPFALTPLLAHFGVDPVYALAFAALLGGVLQVAWLAPALKRRQLTAPLDFTPDASVLKLRQSAGPMLLASAVYQLNTLFAGRLLSALPRGSASYYSYAQRLADIPQGLFAAAFAAAAVKEISERWARGERAGAAASFERALRLVAFVATPVSVLLAVYAEAIVPLVFGYGRFASRGEHGVYQVVASLRWQALAVALLAYVAQTLTVFGAMEKRRETVKFSVANLVVFALVGTLATPRYGHVGAGIATFIATAVQLALLLRAVQRLLPELRLGAHVLPTVLKSLAASGVAALAARAATRWLPVTGPGLRAKVLALAVGAALVALYLAAAWVLRCNEMVELGRRFQRRR